MKLKRKRKEGKGKSLAFMTGYKKSNLFLSNAMVAYLGWGTPNPFVLNAHRSPEAIWDSAF